MSVSALRCVSLIDLTIQTRKRKKKVDRQHCTVKWSITIQPLCLIVSTFCPAADDCPGLQPSYHPGQSLCWPFCTLAAVRLELQVQLILSVSADQITLNSLTAGCLKVFSLALPRNRYSSEFLNLFPADFADNPARRQKSAIKKQLLLS